MWVLVSTVSMHSALLFSMKPMPPMSAASMKTSLAPAVLDIAASSNDRSACTFSASGCTWYHSDCGFTSTERTLLP